MRIIEKGIAKAGITPTGSNMSTNPNETTQTVVNRMAPFIEDYTRRLLDPAFALGQTRRDLPQQEVAPLSNILARDIQEVKGIPSFIPFLGEAADIARGTAQAPTAENLQQFMDPNLELVRDAALKEIDRGGLRQLSQLRGNQVAQGAFGGTRQAVQEAELGRGLQDVRAKTIAGLQSQAFQDAMNAFERQKARESGLATLLGNIGLQGQRLTAGLGGLEQQFAQRQLDADFLNQQRRVNEPFARIQFISDILRGVPSLEQRITSDRDPGATPLQSAIGLGGALATATGVIPGVGGLFGGQRTP
tara:strand:- start:4301 stop:5212 length:912 start_codon:yes stop_codon:yes gene_type:complete